MVQSHFNENCVLPLSSERYVGVGNYVYYNRIAFLQVIVNIMRPILMLIISCHKELHKITKQYIYTIYN